MPEEEISGAEHTRQTGRLSVVATTADGIRVLTLAGEIDHHTGDTLCQALGTTGTARPRIVVDMHLVTFMDSSGINILIAAHQALSEAGGWLRLAAVGATVKRTLSIVGVDALIGCHDTLPQALTG
ncbi:STAS domain-containing protein [Streptomyces gilvifuscus]|uniref:Anti-sigma factor antagonist n=2 Tax=Streptomyces gilvifuscus TaxID=1550617 RepID=A0ABT5G9H3_9ACTN|nr:STAS domain-containing protein [Streptomyces gilvifuscus]MDC2961522.1 STAS domain-containing protein [Streptomyces gilvifuscus]